ncbi:hypothetical protein ACFR9U_00945 [Halorientalis brevis]|uniref:Uncharacterized protein n=1 Tax=Halorientalis brevis TaxID=1126241 RepID=A0ABD6C5W7_9EURY|nr:hypothetical protein [Halorientalis brevis]
MTSDQDPTADANGLSNVPLEESRRTLLRLLGSATTVGVLSGTAAASSSGGDGKDDDDHDKPHHDGDGHGHKKPCKADIFDWRGMSLHHDKMCVRKLYASPVCRDKKVFGCKHLKVGVKGDTVTKTHVEQVKMRESLEQRLLMLVKHLADGDMAGNFDDLDHVDSHLPKCSKKHFKRLKKDFKHYGPACALKYRLRAYRKHEHRGCKHGHEKRCECNRKHEKPCYCERDHDHGNGCDGNHGGWKPGHGNECDYKHDDRKHERWDGCHEKHGGWEPGHAKGCDSKHKDWRDCDCKHRGCKHGHEKRCECNREHEKPCYCEQDYDHGEDCDGNHGGWKPGHGKDCDKKHDDKHEHGKHCDENHDSWKPDHGKERDGKHDDGKHDHEKYRDWKDKHGDRKPCVLLFEIFLIFILVMICLLFFYDQD